MEIKNLILIVVAIINVILGVSIYVRNKKSPINISFVLLMIFTGLWSIGLAFSREYAGSTAALSWSRSTYLTSLFIGVILLYFSFVFPYQERISRLKNIFIWSPFIILSLILIFDTNFIIKEMTVMPWGYDNVYSGGYLIFSIVFIYYFVWAFINMIRKYFKSHGTLKIQLRSMIIGLGLAGIFGIIFDLILPYMGNWKFNWLGPYFTIFVLFSVSYLLFFRK